MKKLFCSLFILILALMVSGTAAARKGPTKLQDRAEFRDLSKQERAEWENYIKRSHHWYSVDLKFIQGELKKTVLKQPVKPPEARVFGFDPKQPADWYATKKGSRVADIVLSFQTPSGGWSKRTDMSQRPRKPGEAFGVERKYIPTFDNKATTTQIDVLAKAYQATGKMDYANAALKGIYLIFQAQYPNGCWPQTYPLVGDYHDYVTYNDDVMSRIMFLLQDISTGKKPFDFAPDDFRKAAGDSVRLGIECILKSQVAVDKRRQVWGAQHNMFSLKPAAARKFEPVSLSSQESTGVLLFLMRLPDPDAAVRFAIESGMGWLQWTAINGYAWVKTEDDAVLKPDSKAPPLWSRFYEIGSNKPVFGDRDGSVHYDVTEISKERRMGYGWYTTRPEKALKEYEKWRKRYK